MHTACPSCRTPNRRPAAAKRLSARAIADAAQDCGAADRLIALRSLVPLGCGGVDEVATGASYPLAAQQPFH